MKFYKAGDEEFGWKPLFLIKKFLQACEIKKGLQKVLPFIEKNKLNIL